MRKNTFLKIVLLLIIAVSFAAYSSNIWDDDEAGASPLAVVDLFFDNPLASHLASHSGAFLPLNLGCHLSPQPNILYIRMHEKSPPAVSSFPLV